MPPIRSNRASPFSPHRHNFRAQPPYPFPSTLPTTEFRRGSRRPYTHTTAILPPSTSDPCRHPSCPLPFPHSRGLYQHLNQASTIEAAHPNFGASNPPPEVWAARERCLKGLEGPGDWEVVNGFIEAHFVAWAESEVVEEEEGMRWAMETVRKEEMNRKEERRDQDMKGLVEGMEDVGIDGDRDRGDDDRAQRSRAPSPVGEGPDRELERVLERDLEEAWVNMEVERAEEAVGGLKIMDK
ncbi:MAG: hypothetical protein LQ348_001408 [Seirophora lacunosa]|nr:MAG: hypothetical protein LQ348_001408 [Seirophora lacunosa]